MRIFIKTSFEGIHNYPEAPKEVEFLKYPHRHLFGVYIEMDVSHDDRELEFIMVKRFITDKIQSIGKELGRTSCEQIGLKIIDWLNREYGSRNYLIKVDEDNENGAIVTELDWINENQKKTKTTLEEDYFDGLDLPSELDFLKSFTGVTIMVLGDESDE